MYKMEYYAALRKDEIKQFSLTRMELGDIM